MRKIIFILVFFVSNSIFSQIEIDWLKLRDVYYKSEYREEMYGYFQIPYFGEELESLDNKEVRITGYMLTLALMKGVFVYLKIHMQIVSFVVLEVLNQL